MSFELQAIAFGAILPAVFAAAVLLLLPRVRPASPPAARIAGAIALGGGFFVAFAVLRIAPLRPEQAWHWLPYAGLLACIVGVFEALPRMRPVGIWLMRAVASAVGAWLLVPTYASIAPHRIWWIIAVGAGALVVWAAISETAGRLRPLLQSFLLLVNCGAAAMVLERSGSAKFMQLAGIVASILGGFWLAELVTSWRARRASPGSAGGASFSAFALRGAAPGIAILLAGLMPNGYLGSFTDVPLASYLLVLAAPVALWVAVLAPSKMLPQPAAVIVQYAAVFIVAGLAVALAFMAESSLELEQALPPSSRVDEFRACRLPLGPCR